MSSKTKTAKKEDNGGCCYWPEEFLKSQMANLINELDKLEQWNSKVSKVSEPLPSLNPGGDKKFDLVSEHMAADINSCIANISVSLIKEVKMALSLVLRDLKTKDKPHQYGRCIECEKFIDQARLIIKPWAKRCLKCQQAFER